ncbi:Hypothetical protein FKW44_022113, partial [Caligus rogercresseyi]
MTTVHAHFFLQLQYSQDDWTKVMTRATATPTKKTGQKNTKRVLSSPGTES